LYVDSGGEDIKTKVIVPDSGGENAIVRGFVQVEHQPRDESDGHARGHIQKSIQVYCTNHSPTSKCGQISPGDILQVVNH
jgi:hypothetical protein